MRCQSLNLPAYNFKQRFRAMVLDGTKRHTMRATRKHRQRVSDTCYLYCGLRTKAVEFLFAAPCTKVEDVVLPELGVLIVSGTELSADECEQLAWRDGFRPELETDAASRRRNAFELMMRFWATEHVAKGRTLPWNGDLIHWDYERRVSHRKVHAT